MDTTEREIICTINFGIKTLDPFKLPPLLRITGGYEGLQDTMSYATTIKERRWWAACFILGQPFA
jgi:hypothetical protein